MIPEGGSVINSSHHQQQMHWRMQEPQPILLRSRRTAGQAPVHRSSSCQAPSGARPGSRTPKVIRDLYPLSIIFIMRFPPLESCLQVPWVETTNVFTVLLTILLFSIQKYLIPTLTLHPGSPGSSYSLRALYVIPSYPLAFETFKGERGINLSTRKCSDGYSMRRYRLPSKPDVLCNS